MTTTRQSTTRLQCPECRMELLPQGASEQMTHVTCCHCGREIFMDKNRYERVECPKCEDVVTGKRDVNLGECCCP